VEYVVLFGFHEVDPTLFSAARAASLAEIDWLHVVQLLSQHSVGTRV